MAWLVVAALLMLAGLLLRDLEPGSRASPPAAGDNPRRDSPARRGVRPLRPGTHDCVGNELGGLDPRMSRPLWDLGDGPTSVQAAG